MMLRVAATLVMMGCAPPARSPSDTLAAAPRLGTPPHAISSVTLERQPCFGTCPVYRVRIDSTGRVDFAGQANVRHAAAATSQISRGAFTRIEAAVLSAGLESLPSRYAAGESGCGRYATDLPVVILSVTTSDGPTKTLHHDFGCSAAPRKLRGLYGLIDSVANTRQWIGQ